MFPRCSLICSAGLAGRAAAGADAAPAKNTLERGAADASRAAKGISEALGHAGPPAALDRGSRCLLRVPEGVRPLALGEAQHIPAPLRCSLEISFGKTAQGKEQRAGIHRQGASERGWDQHRVSPEPGIPWSLGVVQGSLQAGSRAPGIQAPGQQHPAKEAASATASVGSPRALRQNVCVFQTTPMLFLLLGCRVGTRRTYTEPSLCHLFHPPNPGTFCFPESLLA